MRLSSTAQEILKLLSSAGERLDIKALSSRLPELPDKAGALEELLEQGLVWHAGRGRFATLNTLGMEKGKVRMRADGSGVLHTDSPDSLRVSIDSGNTLGTLDGDTVLVRLLEPELARTGYRGRVVHILERSRDKMAGIARKQRGRWFLDPLDPRLPKNIPMETGDNEIKQGDLIGCSVVYHRQSVTVKADRTVGSPDSPKALIDSVCIDSGLPGSFPDTVTAAAEISAGAPVPHGSRRDLRNLFALTIDPVDARDYDDAISIEKLEKGGFRLGVHIADVAVFAPPGSPVDREAYARGTSVYLPDRVIPMIPEVLSNGACSLQPDQDRLTKTVLLDYDSSGRRTGFSVFSSMIKSRRRLCYAEVLEILNGDSSGETELDSVFRDFSRLNTLLNQVREQRGSVDLGASEFRTVFGNDGIPQGFRQVPDDMSHRMIENFMVEANRAVAEYCGWLDLEVLYRVHGEPAPQAAEKLKRTLSIYGFTIPGQSSPRASALSKAVEKARDTPLYPLVREAVLRSLQRAVYSPRDSGHYGLALMKYMHFTSPIRRYPDLMVHQAITAYEQGQVPGRDFPVSSAAESCSALERRADAAERSATELMALLYLSQRTGEVFRGVVRDSVDFGLFVRLLDVPVEGLLHVSAFRGNRYLTGSGLQPGSPVTVSVEKADPLQRKLSLVPAEPAEEDTHD